VTLRFRISVIDAPLATDSREGKYSIFDITIMASLAGEGYTKSIRNRFYNLRDSNNALETPPYQTWLSQNS
jgi:hypothetical protein